MNAEKKEGVVIVVVAIALLAVIALLTHWERGFSSAWVGYFSEDRYDSCSGSILICGLASRDNPDDYYYINFSTVLIVFIPVLTYGVLRAFGTVKRVFGFEKGLFKFMHQNDGQS
jgi:hypothetical protein